MSQNENNYYDDPKLRIALNRDQHRHEQSQQKELHNYELSKQENDNVHERSLEKSRLGLVGRFFGNGDNASKNITATVCVLLIIGGAVVSFYAYAYKDDKELARNIWGVIAPIITLSLGYLFGKR